MLVCGPRLICPVNNQVHHLIKMIQHFSEYPECKNLETECDSQNTQSHWSIGQREQHESLLY